MNIATKVSAETTIDRTNVEGSGSHNMIGRVFLCSLTFLAAGLAAHAQPTTGPERPASVRLVEGVPFATVDGHELKLDLYLPEGVVNPPLLIWVHGGGWSRGARAPVSTFAFVEDGYAMASIDHRLSPVAPFPAQLHDIKGAIRFLRAQAAAYGYDASRVAIIGVSAGAHLAALAAVTNGDASVEGTTGGNLDQSSDLAAVVSYFGASNLTSILRQSTPFGLGIREPGLQALFGGPPDEKTELAKLASPVFHVDASDPPLLLLHGDQDPQMPINQSHELQGAYRQAGLDVHFEVVHGAVHGGDQFFDEERTALVNAFLDKHMRHAR
jgi:acetyl esterase/lipase